MIVRLTQRGTPRVIATTTHRRLEKAKEGFKQWRHWCTPQNRRIATLCNHNLDLPSVIVLLISVVLEVDRYPMIEFQPDNRN